MKRFGLKEITIEMGLFEYAVICVVGDQDKIEKYLQWKFENKSFKHTLGDYRGICFFVEGYVPIVWIPRKPKTPREFATLSHESLHAVFHLFDWAGLPRTKDNEELITHSMAHIITHILDGLKKL